MNSNIISQTWVYIWQWCHSPHADKTRGRTRPLPQEEFTKSFFQWPKTLCTCWQAFWLAFYCDQSKAHLSHDNMKHLSSVLTNTHETTLCSKFGRMSYFVCTNSQIFDLKWIDSFFFNLILLFLYLLSCLILFYLFPPLCTFSLHFNSRLLSKKKTQSVEFKQSFCWV